MADRASSLGAFPRYTSKINPSSDEATKNVADWEPVMKKWDQVMTWAAQEGPQKHVDRHHARGMLSVRDRVALILDEDSPFLELLPSAGYHIKHSSPSASSLAGIGLVHGQMVLIAGNIPTLNSGSANETTVKKQARLSDIALENGLPTISLTQSAGADLPQQFLVFHPGGAGFRDIARRSAAGSPTCTVVFGSSTAGGAYQPGMSGHSIFVKDQAQVFLGGPPLVYMATGEETTAEALGGADMHTSVSGVGDAFAADEFEACRLARSWVAGLPPQRRATTGLMDIRPPVYDPRDLLQVVPVSIRQPLDMREVLARIVDDSRFEPFKPTYGPGLLCCTARIHGRLACVLANQSPVLHADEARKATHFIRRANESGTPLVFLHNVTGFMVGTRAERDGIVKAGSSMIDAVARSGVPHVSILCGASYGAGNYAMCGRAYAPRFLFSWPNSRCSVMGPEQLAGVMGMIAREAAAKAGADLDEAALSKRTDGLRGQVERESESYTTSAWCLDDGVIDPRDTRDVLGMCLEICDNRPGQGNPGMRGVSRI